MHLTLPLPLWCPQAHLRVGLREGFLNATHGCEHGGLLYMQIWGAVGLLWSHRVLMEPTREWSYSVEHGLMNLKSIGK